MSSIAMNEEAPTKALMEEERRTMKNNYPVSLNDQRGLQWLFPVRYRNHWFLYALDISKGKLYVLDSMYSESNDEKRGKFDEYVFPCEYDVVPKQPNTYNCGVFVIEFMRLWDEGETSVAMIK
ncbi:hypothetical protein PIB30_010048 [Stylosanthes scabra]|uniref:Ubiquitin-like protease family profile domain-containing protein n=1 Tax=Stylosanthes scabra TaxID=79078 RepID=A0ABU6W609_9FABA|nr:hypothetical protein [Stylosanthes scabra]